MYVLPQSLLSLFASRNKFVNILGIDSGYTTYVHSYYPYFVLIYKFCTLFMINKEIKKTLPVWIWSALEDLENFDREIRIIAYSVRFVI